MWICSDRFASTQKLASKRQLLPRWRLCPAKSSWDFNGKNTIQGDADVVIGDPGVQLFREGRMVARPLPHQDCMPMAHCDGLVCDASREPRKWWRWTAIGR